MQTTLLLQGVCNKIKKLMCNFIWGSSDEKRTWHTVAWDNICRPKNEGGLGIHKGSYYNQALIMKLTWNLLNEPSTMWVRIIKAKYKCGEDAIPKVQITHNCSSTWRAIVSVWDKMIEGMQWTLGNGSTIRLWSDSWLPYGITLKDVTMQPIVRPLLVQR
jgi:hypothetical protein